MDTGIVLVGQVKIAYAQVRLRPFKLGLGWVIMHVSLGSMHWHCIIAIKTNTTETETGLQSRNAPMHHCIRDENGTKANAGVSGNTA